GPNGSVYALAIQGDGKILIGGEFSIVNGQNRNRIARLNQNGSLDNSFFVTSGADGTIFNINPQTDGTIYVGGAFTSFNDTHRLGFTRLNADGSVDTSFMDTAYNQFAGLPRRFFDDQPGTVLASGVQTDGKVLIGGSFQFVGGGQFNANVRNNAVGYGYDLNIWPEPKTRDGIRNRSNVARLIGGATPGPGNIGLLYENYSANKSQSAFLISLMRTNGFLGSASANFSVLPGVATSGADYGYLDESPYYSQSWNYAGPTRMHSDGLFGTNTIVENAFGGRFFGSTTVAGLSYVTVSLLNNPAQSGDVAAAFEVSNPSSDNFFLGGQNIPLGAALGRPIAPFNIIDDHHQSGVFGFASSSITATGNVSVSVIRTNGSYGVVSLNYTSNSGGTAIFGTDFRLNPVIGTMNFANGETNRAFTVQILSSNSVSAVEKTVNLKLLNLNAPINGDASFGRTNTVVRIINPNFQGFLNFTTNAYSANLSAGTITLTVARTVGSKGTLTLQYGTTNGTAINGVNYVGATNVIQWNNGDVTPRTITIPLINNGVTGPNRQFHAFLFNPMLNGVPTPSLLGPNTSAVLTILNDNSYGTFQFSASGYTVNEEGGYATLSVNRTGSSLGTAAVSYSTADSTALAGVNYLSTSGTLTFASGQVSTNFNISILNDGAPNPAPTNFYFTVSMTVSAGASAGAPTNVAVVIVDAQSFNRPPGAPDVAFNPDATVNDDVLALALQNNGQILLGGNFISVNGTPESHIARLNADGTLDAFGFLSGLPGVNGTVRAIVSQSNDRILIGGIFSQVNGVVRNYIARLNSDGALDTSFNPGSGADNTVYALAETFINGVRKIYAGGSFTSIAGVPNFGIARLNEPGSADTAFNAGTGANGAVLALAVYPTNSIHAGKLLVAGSFTQINGVDCGRIARLNVDGSLDTNFVSTVGANDAIRALAIQNDGRILIGGVFTNVNGVMANRIARLNSDGSLDVTFASNVSPGANDIVNAILLQPDNRIVLGGQFTQANGVTRNRITRLMPSGLVDPTINFGEGANGDVNALVIQPDGMIVLAGGFTSFNGEPHGRVARIYGGSVIGSGTFEFTTGNFQRDEDGAVAFITIRRMGGTSGPNPDGTGSISLNFATSDGTAVDGVNYDAVITNITFPAGEVLASIPIQIIQDFVITPDLIVNLLISNPTAPAGLGNQTDAILTIVNKDSAVSFFSAAYTVGKNIASGRAAIQVIRQGTSGGTGSVTFTTTNGGTAVAGTDYLPTTETVTFNPGETLKIVDVPILDNGIPGGNKTLALALINPSGTILTAPSNAILTILDTVIAPGRFSFATNSYTANEGDGTVTLTILRTDGSSGNASVNYSLVAGTAQSGINYSLANGTVNFGDGQTLRTLDVPLINNTLVQGPVSFSVTLSGPTSGALLLAPTNTTVTILDNDEALAVISSGAALVAESNPNNVIDPSEAVTISFALRVSTGTNLNSLVATLLPTNGITSPSSPQNYGALNVRGHAASRNFSFTVNPAYTNGQHITATFRLQETGIDIGTVQFDFVLGTATTIFSNTNSIVLNDNGPASPYPSTILVSGVGGSLTKATLSLNKFTHSFPQDIDALVRAPSQQAVLFLNNAGSANAANNLNLTFDDAAGSTLPQGSLSSGTYKPSVYNPITVFPATAPAGPYPTNLSTFNGSNPNGIWSLYVIDDSPVNSGTIANGWSLTLSTLAIVSAAADVGVAVSSAASSVTVGSAVSYGVGVTNYGPSASSGIFVTNTLPAGFTFGSAVATQGSAVNNGGVVVWNVGSLALNAGAKLTISGTMSSMGSKTNSAVVRSSVTDPNPADDSASFVINVTTAQPPQLLAIKTNGVFQLNITGASVPTVVQASTNLLNWVPVVTNTPPFVFSDPSAANLPYRFYRALIAQ
ncbi:MAG: DUF11 domain-containing protein, partial [Akkermansiaceae bacterium]|nr:DUF11 domain-containing protein [Verrucomicrobiales bacterium]